MNPLSADRILGKLMLDDYDLHKSPQFAPIKVDDKTLTCLIVPKKFASDRDNMTVVSDDYTEVTNYFDLDTVDCLIVQKEFESDHDEHKLSKTVVCDDNSEVTYYYFDLAKADKRIADSEHFFTNFPLLKNIVSDVVDAAVVESCEKMREFIKNGVVVKLHKLQQYFSNGNVNQQLQMSGEGDVFTCGLYLDPSKYPLKNPMMKTPIEAVKISLVDGQMSALARFFTVCRKSDATFRLSKRAASQVYSRDARGT